MHNEYLKILGLNSGASESDIKRAYRQLAKKYHPDINKDDSSKQKFIKITEAYKFLTDVGPRPNNEYVGYDYNPYQSDYDQWRQKARAYAKRKAREEAAYQQSLLRKIYARYNYITALVVAFNVIIITDYLLPPDSETEDILSVSQIYIQQKGRGGTISVYAYDHITFKNYSFRIKKDQGRKIIEDKGVVYTSPLLNIIKYAEIPSNRGLNTIFPTYGIYTLYKLLVPAALLFGLMYFRMEEKNSNKITVVVVVSTVLLIQLFLLFSFSY